MKNQVVIEKNTFEQARKEIRNNKGKFVVFTSGDDALNRKVLEKEDLDVLLITQLQRKDKLKQRDSGFNHVLAKIAKKRKVAIGINLDEIINSDAKQKAKILARIKQNIKLCNKNKLKMRFVALDKKNKRNEYDLKALGSVLGMPTWMLR